jgi:hypothetical protein
MKIVAPGFVQYSFVELLPCVHGSDESDNRQIYHDTRVLIETRMSRRHVIVYSISNISIVWIIVSRMNRAKGSARLWLASSSDSRYSPRRVTGMMEQG